MLTADMDVLAGTSVGFGPAKGERTLEGVTVCYVSTEGFGGVWRTYKQARTLAEAGARVVVVGYEGMVPPQLSAPPFECTVVRSPFRSSSSPIRVLRVATNLTVNQWGNTAITRPRSIESLRRRRAPLIEAVAASGASIVQAVDLPALDTAHQAAERLGAKLVYASHELWTGFLSNPDLGMSKELAECLLATERRYIGAADLVTVTSDHMGQRLVELYGIPQPLTLLNSPVSRVESALPTSSPVRLVYHGGLSTDRNIDGLIRAMDSLQGAATLDIHGFSRTMPREVLQGLIDSLKLNDVVRLCGPFDYATIVELLHTYDVGVMAARIVEENFAVTLPNKIFDCMCAGIAVAMNESPAVAAILREVPFGVLLDSESPETIASGLAELIADPDRISEMKRAAVEAAPRYSWDVQGRRLTAALAAMLGRGST